MQRSVSGYIILAVCTVGCGSGCISNAWFNSFLDPTQTGNFRENVVHEIQRTISFRDNPTGIVGAEDPRPEDLVAVIEEYRIGPGDTLRIRLLDFLQVNAETELVKTVDDVGNLDVTQLDYFKVEGMTARELQNEIIQRARAAEIYPPSDPAGGLEPTVTVEVLNQQQRQFNLAGAITYPGPYQIPRPDCRLREAINLGGGLGETIKVVWVYRGGNPKTEKTLPPSGPPAGSAGEPPPVVPPGPPVSPVSMAELPSGSAPAAAADRPVAPPPGALATPEAAERELIDAANPPAAAPGVRPAPGNTAPVSPATPAEPPRTGARAPKYTYVNDAFVDTAPQAPQPDQAPALGPPRGAATRPVDWDALAEEGRQRIIRIPADKLRNGDPNFNIVVQNGDWIRIDAGPVGYYYLAGHVLRPGTYAFSGEDITLSRAIASAGMLDAVAWPTRCEIRRKLDGDREEITQWDLARILDGKDPDLYLKQDDMVNVGTHAIAPFLATIRNAFRFTYGFGFVYDRNFADIDSYGPDANPDLRHRQERQERFSGLFR